MISEIMIAGFSRPKTAAPRGGRTLDELVGEVEELENQRAEFVVELVIKTVKEVQIRDQEATVGMTYKDFKVLIRKELCPNNEMQKLETKFWCHAMVGAGHAVYTDRFHKLARLVPHLVTLENKRIEMYIYGLALHIRAKVAATGPTTIQSVVLKSGMLTDEAIRNGSLRKNTKNRGNGRELSRDDNKRSRTRREFATTTNPVRKMYTGTTPKCINCSFHHNPEIPYRHGNNGNQACEGAFIIGAEEARQDPNIVTGTFTLNNHYATTLFDSGVDYSFVYTTFIPMLDIESNDLGFSYEIEIASGQLVEINKVIRDCKPEIEGHTFDIDLIPFGHESFDLIVGMDWLFRHKDKIVCHEKKLKYIVIVRNFLMVFPDDLSGLPPSLEFKFRIDLIPREMLVAKSPCRLVPSEMEELSSQLRELQDKGFI
uniref:Putative reverse transcriptase domain-containing protein n=1 Tax=Tanacetum cinerariifolium TaxID=118510 RepID=A0A6L2K0H0_TANCI|nr:putative reverse transcriptase domain-containing protein [Tanacetum cinerariifolium]